MKNTVTVAPAGVAEDSIRAHTGEIIGRESGAHPDDISVSGITLLHIPIVTAELVALGRSYRKILQAATSKIIWDETRKCIYATRLLKQSAKNVGESSVTSTLDCAAPVENISAQNV